MRFVSMFIKVEFLKSTTILQNEQFESSMTARKWIGAHKINYERMNSREKLIPYMDNIQYNIARATKIDSKNLYKIILKLKYY